VEKAKEKENLQNAGLSGKEQQRRQEVYLNKLIKDNKGKNPLSAKDIVEV